MSLNSDTLKQLADEVLTFIEQREAEQVAYGVYDVTMTGAEVIESWSSQPDLNCPLFQAGECWWVLSQPGKARREPLNIKRKSGSDRAIAIEPDDGLVITTSALEVGYDDEDLMCVLQYTAPANVASFVQRKGRGGRKVGTRPIVVTVILSQMILERRYTSTRKISFSLSFRSTRIVTFPLSPILPCTLISSLS
jgi:Lhr-like helicase